MKRKRVMDSTELVITLYRTDPNSTRYDMLHQPEVTLTIGEFSVKGVTSSGIIKFERIPSGSAVISITETLYSSSKEISFDVILGKNNLEVDIPGLWVTLINFASDGDSINGLNVNISGTAYITDSGGWARLGYKNAASYTINVATQNIDSYVYQGFTKEYSMTYSSATEAYLYVQVDRSLLTATVNITVNKNGYTLEEDYPVVTLNSVTLTAPTSSGGVYTFTDVPYGNKTLSIASTEYMDSLVTTASVNSSIVNKTVSLVGKYSLRFELKHTSRINDVLYPGNVQVQLKNGSGSILETQTTRGGFGDVTFETKYGLDDIAYVYVPTQTVNNLIYPGTSFNRKPSSATLGYGSKRIFLSENLITPTLVNYTLTVNLYKDSTSYKLTGTQPTVIFDGQTKTASNGIVTFTTPYSIALKDVSVNSTTYTLSKSDSVNMTSNVTKDIVLTGRYDIKAEFTYNISSTYVGSLNVQLRYLSGTVIASGTTNSGGDVSFSSASSVTYGGSYQLYVPEQTIEGYIYGPNSFSFVAVPSLSVNGGGTNQLYCRDNRVSRRTKTKVLVYQLIAPNNINDFEYKSLYCYNGKPDYIRKLAPSNDTENITLNVNPNIYTSLYSTFRMKFDIPSVIQYFSNLKDTDWEIEFDVFLGKPMQEYSGSIQSNLGFFIAGISSENATVLDSITDLYLRTNQSANSTDKYEFTVVTASNGGNIENVKPNMINNFTIVHKANTDRLTVFVNGIESSAGLQTNVLTKPVRSISFIVTYDFGISAFKMYGYG